MNILISINDNFIEYTLNMLKSYYKHNKERLNIYLLYEKLSRENIDKIIDLINKNGGGSLFKYRCNFSNSNFRIFLRHISKETFFRLYAPFILPKEVDRVLYLDCDIIINGSIKELFEMPLDGNILAAAENIDPNPELYKRINARLGRPIESTYFNAGVLLIDLKAYRDFTTEEEINSFINENKNILLYQDQDVLNKMFDGKIKKLDKTYNYQISHVRSENLEFDKKIIHYLSTPKPWSDMYRFPFHAVFYYKHLIDNNEYDRFNYLFEKHFINSKLTISYKEKIMDLINKI